MKVLIVGMDGFIGSALFARMSEKKGTQVFGTSRRGHGIALDLLDRRYAFNDLPQCDVVYLCAGVTRFIDCESNPESYRVNVDAQIEIARIWPWKVVYLSSDAVERALHTNYGMQKALCEIGLRAVCDPVIVRLPKVTPDALGSVCEFLAYAVHLKPGVYRWPHEMPR